MLFVLMPGLAFAHIWSDGPLHRFHYTERCMGTLFQITLYAPDGPTARRTAELGFKTAQALDAKFSDYKPDSELMQLCGKAGQGPVKVSDELFEVISTAQEIAQRTEGAFDVTIGPVVRLWRLARRTRELPEQKELAEALSKVGYQNLKLDAIRKTIDLTMAGMKLDLGGIAKGYAADAMLKVVRDAGCPRCLIAAGGDIVAGDAPPDADGWSVAISTGNGTQPRLVLKNMAVSTSGDAEQFVEVGGQRYSHIIDPKTGLGLTDHVSVTVIATSGTKSDALATAIAALGPAKGLRLLGNDNETAARLMKKRGDQWDVHESPRFKTWLLP